MSADRPPARSKRTPNGKIMGRPFGDRGPTPAVTEPPRVKAYFVRLRQPRAIEDPTTGELRRPFGPGVPVYEMREVHRGRPRRTRGEELKRIVEAVAGFDRVGFAAIKATEQKPSTVKRDLRRVRWDVRKRDESGDVILKSKHDTFKD